MASNTISKSLSTIILSISQMKSIGNLRAKLARALSSKPGFCPAKSSKKSGKKKWWAFSKKECEVVEPKKKKEPPELCRQPTEDPDLSAFGGTPFRTCGSAYIIQKERLPDPGEKIEDDEQKIVEKMEKHPDIKNVVDPMPPFETVEKRMLDLYERKLHPLYKKYIFLPKKPSKFAVPKFVYKSRSGPVSNEEIPAKLKCKEFHEKKNIFADFKRVDPPRQMLAKMLEIQLNEKPTMQRKGGANNVDDILKA